MRTLKALIHMKKKRMRIGYARVSTDDQTLTLQTDALKAAGCVRIFTDHGVSGAETCREGLNEALAVMKPGDVFVVWKLDRLGRSLRFVLDLIEQFHGVGCGFSSLTEGFDTTTNTGRLVCHILAAIGEFERGLISERTRAGMAVARRQGKVPGRRFRLTHEDIAEAYRLVSIEQRAIAHVARDLDVCHDTLTRGFRRYGLAA